MADDFPLTDADASIAPHVIAGTVGYVLGVAKLRDLRIHRVWASIPGWSLCGVYCNYHPNVPSEATGRICATCNELEKREEVSP